MLTHLNRLVCTALAALPPDPPPQPPPGVQALTSILAEIKYVAGLALLAGFFVGLVTFSVGRLVDNHRGGRVGSTMILSSLAGALLYGIGYTMITTLAGSK